jgi:DNA-binding LacI/PurR family transcriptional regulator
VIGYDNTPLGASYQPPLTTVHQNLYEGGLLLARKVLAMIAGEDVASEQLPTHLVVRGT